jgi:mannose-6-phosphate isomerase-like protein (cupin superfamily)
MDNKARYVVIGVFVGLVLAAFLILGQDTKLQEKGNTSLPVAAKTPPDVDYDRAAKLTFNPGDNYFRFDQLAEAYRAPGEFTYRLDGEKYGFNSLSFIITQTQPNGGPNLHVHEFEEAHVLLEGTAKYQIGDKTFTAEAPYIVKVPAGVPHTFINAGTKPFQLVAVFASPRLGSKRIAPNPLIPAPSKK